MKTTRIAFCCLFVLSSLLSKPFAAEGEEKSIFPDKNLEKAVRKFVFEKRNNDKPIVESDIKSLSILEGKRMGISGLSGLEKARSLASIDIPGNEVKDLGPIKDLERVQFLDVSNNQIEDITPLASMKALQYVELSGNKVKDVTPLKGLTNMAALYLSTNEIEDISALTHFPKISSLYLQNNNIEDISGIGNLRGLSSLSLSNNKISDLSGLKGVNNLYYLFLENNKIEDLGPLVEIIEADKERRFAPYLNLFLAGNPLSEKAKKEQIPRLKELGVRVKSS